MARTGKALNLWLPEVVMEALDTYAKQHGMTETQAVIRAIGLLSDQSQVTAEDVQTTIAHPSAAMTWLGRPQHSNL